jgi:hypothetical protein
MKKTYAAPTIVASGDAVRETKGTGGPAPDVGGETFALAPGALGFNL